MPAPRRERLVRRLTDWAGDTPYQRVAAGLHVVSLCAALVLLLYIDRHVWFGVDDFDFLSERGLHGATLSIWAPHNEHWSTLPILIWRGLFSIVGLRTAIPYLVVLVVAHLTLAHLLWRAMSSMSVEPLVNTALVAIFAVLGAGASDILRPFQIGFTGAVLLGWAFILLENHEQGGLGRRDLAAWVLSIAALMFSGVSVTMVVVGGLVALARRGWRAAVVAVAPAATVFIVWFALAGDVNYQLGESFRSTLLALPGYVYSGLKSAASNGGDLGFLGPAALLVLGLWLVLRRDLVWTIAAPAVAGVVGAVIFFVITGFGRVQLGDTEASYPRYVYIAAALTLPAVGLALSAVVSPFRSRARRRQGERAKPPRTRWLVAGLGSRRLRAWRTVVVLSALVVVLVSNLSQLITYRNNTVALTSQTERQVVAAAAIATSEPTIPNSLPIRNLHASNLTIRSLIVFARQGLLPTGVRPSAADELAAHTFTQIGDTPDALYPSVGSTVTGTSAGVRITAGGSCASVTSSVVRGFVRLQVPVRTSLLVRDPSVGEMTIVLLVKGHRGPPISFPVRAGRANWLDDALSDSSIVVYLPSAATLGSC